MERAKIADRLSSARSNTLGRRWEMGTWAPFRYLGVETDLLYPPPPELYVNNNFEKGF